MFNKIKDKAASFIGSAVNSVQEAAKERQEFLEGIEGRVEGEVVVNFDKVARNAGIDISSPVYGEDIQKLRGAYKKNVENNFIKQHEIDISRRCAKKTNAKLLRTTLLEIVKKNKSAIKDENQTQLLLALANKLGVTNESEEDDNHSRH